MSNNKIDSDEKMSDEQNENEQAMPSDVKSEMDDKSYHALLAEINSDPSSYKEATQTREKSKWQEAINEELKSMEKK